MGSVVVARQGWIKMLSGEWLGPCQASWARSSPTSEQNSLNASSLSKFSSKTVLARQRAVDGTFGPEPRSGGAPAAK
jgi:hypothetical protein